MDIKKNNRSQKALFIIVAILIANYNSICSQTIEDIYCHLPNKYLDECHLASLVKKDYDAYNDEPNKRYDRVKLKQLLHLNLKDINSKRPDLGGIVQKKLIDNKEGYMQLCDFGCTWEFTMRIFNDKNLRKKYVAICCGSNDGATSGTNKKLYFLQIIQKSSTIDYIDVTKQLQPKLTYKEVLTKRQQLKFKKVIDYKDTNPLESFELPQHDKTCIKGFIEGGDTFCLDTDENPDCRALSDLLQGKSISFKWNGNKFIRLTKHKQH